jgi:mRNA interferase MazF
MPDAKRGDVWLADLGLAAKVRPVLILSVPYSDHDYALYAVVPHTTTPRGSDFEVELAVRGLKAGAFNVQGLLGVPPVRLIRKLTKLTPEQMTAIENVVRSWLGLELSGSS